MSRGQTTAVIVVAVAIASVIAWRACAGGDRPESSTTTRVDAGSERVRRAPARRGVVTARHDGGARDITLRARSVQPGTDAAAEITLDGDELAVAPPLAILGASRIVVGDGELHEVDVVVADAGFVARAQPEPFATPEAAPGEPSGSVAGVITTGGARAPDVTVELIQLATFGPGRPVTQDRPPGATDDIRLPPRRFVATSGAVRIDGLQPGSYLAIVHAGDSGARLVPATVTVGPPADISADVPAPASIGGSVKNGLDDAPLAGAVVRLRVDGVVVRTTATTAGGIYLLDNVPASGAADLELDAAGCTADPIPLALAIARTTRVIVATCP